MRVAFFTLGCKVNLFETQALQQLAVQRGHEIVERDADAVIVNTCTVTAVSDHKNIRAFHKLRRDHPRAVLAACGCFAALDPERVRQTGEIDLVCGTKDRAEVLRLCEQAVCGAAVDEPLPDFLPAGVPQGRTRALLKIEDGCDNYCAYCIIPYARGHVRSLPAEEALRQARRLQAEGVHEIVLTGIEIASYGRDLTPPLTLTALLCRLLPACPSVRFRLGSLDPRLIDETFCEALHGFSNLARQFHLSLQSGCDTVLARMGRRYTTAQFYNKVRLLEKAFPNCSVTTDLITGFPGETEAEFCTTLDFLRQCGFASVHVFPYSARSGTRAAEMPDQVPQEERAARAERAKAVAAACGQAYRSRFVGRTMTVLPEHRTEGRWAAHGAYGFPVYIEGERPRKNEPLHVRLTALHRDGLLAVPAEKDS